METAVPESVRVNIFNQTYSLRSESGAEHIRRIAQLVDERMWLISSQLSTHDVAKVAVLAALNIADEMQALRNRYEKELEALLLQATGDDQKTDNEDGKTAAGGDDRRSWFEDIFDSGEPARGLGERLSSQISAKLRMLRQTDREAPAIESDEDGL